MLYIIDILDDPDHAFSDVFKRFIAQENLRPEYRRMDGLAGVPDWAELDPCPTGILISGSLQSVSDQAPWMLALEQLIQSAHAQEIPILGLCFGHQIIASALGGVVSRLETWEFGEHPVYLQGEHPLLQGLPPILSTLQVHQDHVSQLPPGALCLGFSEKTPHQIFAVGQSFGVQFHPEYTPEMLQRIVAARSQKLLDKGPFRSQTHLEALAERWRLPTAARGILTRFLKPYEVQDV